jgi:hypothetical protein
MKLSNRILSFLSCAAVLSLAPVAHAGVINGTVWEGATFYPNNLPASAPPASFTNSTTFTLTGSGNMFNFQSGTSNDLVADPTYTLLGFLQSGGDVATLANPALGGDSINNDMFQFTGQTFLTAGVTYTINHDDGMYLYLDGIQVISSGAPTVDIPSSFTVATTGIYNFNLLYGEVNGAPGDLNGNLGTILPTPEPNSLMLLGTGVLGAAGMLRRRLSA